MSNQKFEKLIEFVINDEEDKARELFHEIVVEKSREIYENLMADEFGGGMDTMDTDIEADEEGFDDVNMDGDDEFADDDVDAGEFGDEEEGVEDIEDRVVDLEEKLDELMAEFDALMGDEEGGMDDEFGGDEFGGDDVEGDDVEGDEVEFGGDEFGSDDEYAEESYDPLAEEVKLTPVAKPSNVEGADNKTSPVTHNSGKKGVGGTSRNPVKTGSSTENGRTAPAAKNAGVNGPQAAGKGAFKSKAPAASTKGEAQGTNASSVVKK